MLNDGTNVDDGTMLNDGTSVNDGTIKDGTIVDDEAMLLLLLLVILVVVPRRARKEAQGGVLMGGGRWCAVSTHKVEVGVSGGLNCDLMCRMTVLEARVAVLRRMAFENGANHRRSLMCAEYGRGWRAAWERR